MVVELDEKKVYVITHPEDTSKHLMKSKHLNDTWICVTEAKDMTKSVEFMAPSQVRKLMEEELERQKAADGEPGNES